MTNFFLTEPCSVGAFTILFIFITSNLIVQIEWYEHKSLLKEEKIRFIVIDKPTVALGMLPPDVLLQIMESSVEKMHQIREEGKLIDYYTSPAGYSIVILEYESADEWTRDKMQIPITNYLESQIYPLADGMTFMKGGIERLKAIAK